MIAGSSPLGTGVRFKMLSRGQIIFLTKTVFSGHFEDEIGGKAHQACSGWQPCCLGELSEIQNSELKTNARMDITPAQLLS